MEPKFIAERITKLRAARNMSEYGMSMEFGKSLGYVQAIVSGRSMPSMEQLFNIIDYFEMTPAEFFQPEYEASPALCSAIHILRGLGEESLQAVLPQRLWLKMDVKIQERDRFCGPFLGKCLE